VGCSCALRRGARVEGEGRLGVRWAGGAGRLQPAVGPSARRMCSGCEGLCWRGCFGRLGALWPEHSRRACEGELAQRAAAEPALWAWLAKKGR
jgi:hypothetical protein